jgi:hypothetical protein
MKGALAWKGGCAEWVDFDESDDNFVQDGVAFENLDSLAVSGSVT